MWHNAVATYSLYLKVSPQSKQIIFFFYFFFCEIYFFINFSIADLFFATRFVHFIYNKYSHNSQWIYPRIWKFLHNIVDLNVQSFNTILLREHIENIYNFFGTLLEILNLFIDCLVNRILCLILLFTKTLT